VKCHHADFFDQILVCGHYQSVERWLEVWFSGSAPPLDWPRPLCVLLQKVRPCNNWRMFLWQMTNSAVHCQQLSTDKVGGWTTVASLGWWCCCSVVNTDSMWPMSANDSNSRLWIFYIPHRLLISIAVVCCVGVICIISAAAEITEFLLVKLRKYLR